MSGVTRVEELGVPQRSADPAGPAQEQLLSVRSLPDVRTGGTIVEVTGEVDTYTAPLLEACLRAQTGRDGVREVVVDLRGVTFLGAVGVAALARAHRRCQSHGASLTILRTDGQRTVDRVLELTGLADALTSPGRSPRTGAWNARRANPASSGQRTTTPGRSADARRTQRRPGAMRRADRRPVRH